MNRWTEDGRPLSDDDLLAIAEADGVDMVKLADMRAHMHHEALFRTHLNTITAVRRFSMMATGELTLNTRTERNSP